MRKAIIIGGIIATGVLATACGAASADSGAPASSSSSASSSSAAPTTPAVTKVTVPSLVGLMPEVAASKLKALGLVASPTGDLSNPAFNVLTQNPSAGTSVEPGLVITLTVGESPAQKTAREAAEKAAADAAAKAAEEAAQAAADGDLATYQEIDTRTWALVAKDPEAHVGEKYVVYGRVTQFDSATGKSAFLARTDGEQQEKYYDYDTNTMITAKDAGAVADIVEDDLVKMYVRVIGTLSYDTQAGGNTTVPKVIVNSHELIGHTD